MNPDESLYLKAKQAYYNGWPIMSDTQFDALEEKIRAGNPQAPVLKIIGAPVPAGSQKKAAHLIPMGSQEKVHSKEELLRWESLRQNNKEALFHASYKGDGGSVGLYYKEGRLIQAITRGDGTTGEDITQRAALFQGVPIQLAAPHNIGVRCEAIITLPDWPKADPDMKTNPRNIATGILGRLDGKKAPLITCLAFDLENLPNARQETRLVAEESEKFLLLEKLGFLTPLWKGSLTLNQVAQLFAETQKTREHLPYWIDGIVVRYETLATQHSLGSSDGCPKGQVAWKFPPEGNWTILKAVQWQVGHTGAITPVALLEPVRIGGTTVTKASLANAENIQTLGAFAGAEVQVVKAGDIIPQVVGVKKPTTDTGHIQTIPIPTHCPVCNHPLAKRTNIGGEQSIGIFCTNPACEAKTTGKIRRFCQSRDIQGLGDSVINALVESEIVTRVPDLYLLEAQKIGNLVINKEKGVRLGLKRAQAITEEIATKATNMPLPELLGAFGTRALGVRRATLMMEQNPGLDSLEAWLSPKLADPQFAAKAGVPNMGAIILEGLREEEKTIRDTAAFVTITATKPKPTGSRGAKSHTICITGALPSGKKKRDYAQALNRAGHTLVDNLTGDVTDLVLANPQGPDSAKTTKAKTMGITLRDEPWLQNLLEEKPEEEEPTPAVDSPGRETHRQLIQSAFP
jgi:DNA ligase (NAD+)